MIDFEINNTGYGYGNGERLTVSVGGTTGIPTTSSFTSSNVFEIEIEKVINDEFTGWSLGVLDTFDDAPTHQALGSNSLELESMVHSHPSMVGFSS